MAIMNRHFEKIATNVSAYGVTDSVTIPWAGSVLLTCEGIGDGAVVQCQSRIDGTQLYADIEGATITLSGSQSGVVHLQDAIRTTPNMELRAIVTETGASTSINILVSLLGRD